MSRRQQGFSLVELTIVVVILGVLATFAVPRFTTSVERTKATEGLSYVHQLQRQQERHLASTGRYATSLTELKRTTGETLETPQFFDVSALNSSDWESKWKVKLTRNGASSGFGRYTIVWSQDGFVVSQSSIPSSLKPDGGSTSAPAGDGDEEDEEDEDDDDREDDDDAKGKDKKSGKAKKPKSNNGKAYGKDKNGGKGRGKDD
jgi:prepilin-type N-terminal cleavage/methylation domain-containing protein